MVVRKLNGLSSQSNAMICDMNKKCPEREAVRRQFATRNFNEGKDITVATLQDAFLKFKRNRQVSCFTYITVVDV